MDDRLFDLLEKLYNEMQKMKGNMATKDDINRLENNMVRMENEIKGHINALYDGYKQSVEEINKIREKIEILADKVEKQEKRLKGVNI